MKVRGAVRAMAAGLLVAGLLLAPCGCRDQGSGAPAAKWQQPENWKQIRPGMAIDQVRGILGDPTKAQEDPAFTIWEYGEGKPGGRVVFAGGIVKDWTSPD